MPMASSPVQHRNVKFPSHMIRKQYRAIRPSLYYKYSWIEYSQCEMLSTTITADTFQKQKRVRNSKPRFAKLEKCYRTRVSGNKLMQHQGSLQHAECVDAYPHYVAVKSGAFQSVV